jgi:hypothetical protein
MRPSLPLQCSTTLRLSAGNSTPCPTALVITTIINRSLGRDSHGQKVVCHQGFAFIFICHLRHRRLLCPIFHWKLAGSSSPRFTGLSLDLANNGNSFAGVRTGGWGGEPASVVFGKEGVNGSNVKNISNEQCIVAASEVNGLTSRRCGLGSVA